MKYEKYDNDGVPYIRITVDAYNIVERPLVDADEKLFETSDTHETEVPPNEPTPAEPYPEGP